MAKRTKTPPKDAKPRPAKKGATTSTRWWEEAQEVPRAGMPDAQRLTKKAKRLRRFVWASVFLFPITCFVAIISLASAGGIAAAPTVSDPYSETKAAAMVEVRKWLAQSPSPVPGGVLISWESASKTEAPGSENRPEEAYTVEVHHLTVADGNGSLYDTEISLGVSDYVGTVLLGPPSLDPIAPSDTSFNETDWPGLEAGNVTDETAAAVLGWSRAFSSGDPGQLRLAVGDTSQSRSYVPLNGATLGEPSFGESAAIFGDDVAVESRDANNAERLVVRVSFPIQWTGVTLGEDEEWPNVTYDLLIDKANTAAPVVVAWGGPGSGPSLKAYDNAIEHREITAGNPDDAPVDGEGVVGSDEPITDGTAPAAAPTADPAADPNAGSTSDQGTGKNKKGKNS